MKLGGECDTVSPFYLPNLDVAILKLGEVGHSINFSSVKPGTVYLGGRAQDIVMANLTNHFQYLFVCMRIGMYIPGSHT